MAGILDGARFPADGLGWIAGILDSDGPQGPIPCGWTRRSGCPMHPLARRRLLASPGPPGPGRAGPAAFSGKVDSLLAAGSEADSSRWVAFTPACACRARGLGRSCH